MEIARKKGRYDHGTTRQYCGTGWQIGLNRLLLSFLDQLELDLQQLRVVELAADQGGFVAILRQTGVVARTGAPLAAPEAAIGGSVDHRGLPVDFNSAVRASVDHGAPPRLDRCQIRWQLTCKLPDSILTYILGPAR
jgi:hypothetical protein